MKSFFQLVSGIVPIFVDLAEGGNPLIREICSAAMHTLPVEATENSTDGRIIKILMTMLHADANKLSVSNHSLTHWTPRALFWNR